MKIKEITDTIERFAPLTLQESYDNAGLIVGRPEDEVEAALVAVDVTDEVLDEAERTGCGLVITHHPLVFHALKRFNSNGCVQRCVERAIRRGIALYACHTNLDSAPGGMSWRLAAMLGVDFIIAVGEKAARIADGAAESGGSVLHFATKEEALPELKARLGPDTAMLVKASRAMRFDWLVERLEKAYD